MKLAVIIPTYSRYDALQVAAESVLAQRGVQVEVIVVDNASPGHLGDRIAAEHAGRVRVVKMSKNVFYCAAANAGARLSDAEYVAILNDDARVDKDWAWHACSVLDADSRIASIASRVMSARCPNILDSAGDGLTMSGLPFNRGWGRELGREYLRACEVFSAAGSCAVYRKADFDRVGGFDEHFVAYVDDIDLGFRLQMIDKKCVYVPECVAFHEGGGTWKPRFWSNYLMERNRHWNVLKNVPAELWDVVGGQILRALAAPAPLAGGGSWRAWAAGQSVASLHSPRVWQQRRQVQRSRLVESSRILSILEPQLTDVCHL